MRTTNAPKTVAQFRSGAVASLRRANPGVKIAVEWETARSVTWPTGATGFVGWFAAAAPTFTRRRMYATWVDGMGMMVK